ncbi:class I SAM-dependent methyltransferase [Falsigemmobacter faecalis]|uniref:Class I SAM-dependent methyltransferase n=1 Tax=Falsigemmobacter faecalis TaxID=2488730 RepID=A0A3P3DGY5_9RHOB|nr:class I SAM-dependent methyltransferase [Falsigemmobacter faecalis]RRH73511.1 class I SAM-dependent methyltransferase [Falsigemmobacter faecalis]
MRSEAVTTSYKRWAPVYDLVFGRVFAPGRARATSFANTHGGEVLEVGVGTGLSLPLYASHLRVTGIDYSQDMLNKAREKVADLGLKTVQLEQMDAQQMRFADESFDIVTALHVLSVVPDPVKTLSEMARVCRRGGHILIGNHFAAEKGILKIVEKRMHVLQDHLGWQADFPIETVLSNPDLQLVERRPMPPLGAMTWLVLKRI